MSDSESTAGPSPDELTTTDFNTYDLPDRPLKYSPTYRQDLRHFAWICASLGIVIGILVLTTV